jgi:hypothetical protein
MLRPTNDKSEGFVFSFFFFFCRALFSDFFPSDLLDVIWAQDLNQLKEWLTEDTDLDLNAGLSGDEEKVSRKFLSSESCFFFFSLSLCSFLLSPFLL